MSTDSLSETTRRAMSVSPFSEIIIRSSSAHELLKAKKPSTLQNLDNQLEDTEDPSPHAQPPASTPLPENGASAGAHLTDNDSAKKIKIEAGSALGEEEDHEMPQVADTAPLGNAEIDNLENDFLSDDDIDEVNARLADNYSALSVSDQRAWEGKRADAAFDAGQTKHFECSVHLLGEDACNTRQEYYPSRIDARPVVSCFFGHNKNEWSQIIKSARVFLCRKCYQRLQHKLDQRLSSIHLPLCREMVARIEKWRPGCLFRIQLTGAMSEKVKRFYEEMDAGLSRQEAAAKIDAAKPVGNTSDARRVEGTPVLFAIELQNRFKGDGKTAHDVRALLDWLEAKLADETIKDFPAFEALLEVRPQDKIMLQTQKRRRAAALKERRLPDPEAAKKKRQPRTKTEVIASSSTNEAREPERPVASDSSEVVATEDNPPPRSFTFVNSVTPANYLASLAPAPGPENTGDELLPTAADLTTTTPMEIDDNNDDPFVSNRPKLPKIMLRLGKGKKPIRAGFVPEETLARISNKRQHSEAPARKDSKDDEAEQALMRPAKRFRLVKPATNTAVRSVQPTTAEAEQGREIRVDTVPSVRSELLSFTVRGVRVIVDIAPALSSANDE